MFHSPEIVIGYHGCDRSVAERIFAGESELLGSSNDYDWLGNGIYFWEGSHDKALKWATESRNVVEPAVVGAFIRLGNCLDLLDIEHIRELEEVYGLVKEEYETLGKELPKNTAEKSDGIRYNRKLDCLIIERLHRLNNLELQQKLELNYLDLPNIQNDPDFIDSVRGLFQEGDEIYENAGFRRENHIQLCIKNPNCIIGYFRPKAFDSKYKAL